MCLLGDTFPKRTFPGTLNSIAPIRAYVAEVARAAGLDAERTYNLCLAVDEIATNIVLHGYEEAGLEGDIDFQTAQGGGHLTILLLDHGRAYDPKEVPQPDVTNPLSQKVIGGWGIFLARSGVDEFDYTLTGDGNVHRFVVRLP